MPSKVNKQFQYYARIGSNRVINGLMHIIVRNDMDKDDAVEEYYTHWAGTEGSGGPDNNAQDAHPFNNTIPGDPGRTGYLRAIGDYDSFLFFVTVAGNLQAHETNGTVLGGTHTAAGHATVMTDSAAAFVSRKIEGQIIKNITDGSQGVITASTNDDATCSGGLSGGTDDEWDTDDVYQICNNPEAQPYFTSAPSHNKCQSFVRYQLLGRHNNVDGHIDNNYLHYGVPVKEFGNSVAGNGYESTLVDQGKVSSSEYLTGSETKDWAEIDDGDKAEEDVTVTGAVLGDYAIASMSIDTIGMQLSATVTAADTVTVVLANHTGVARNLASGTLRVVVIRYALATTPAVSDRLVVNQGLFSDQNFGAELSGLNSNNTFFSPVSLIEIYGLHAAHTFDTVNGSDQFESGQDYFALTNHDTAFYNLVVDIDFFGYVNPAGATVSFFRNKVNIFFQPFGESAEVKFSQTPGTAFTS